VDGNLHDRVFVKGRGASSYLPTVGGEIDIALVTNRLGFRWITQKGLYGMLEKEAK
jgi:hypothetical protein